MLTEIRNWMKGRGYQVWYRDKSDTVFVRPEAISVTLFEKIGTSIYNIFLWLRRKKGILLRRVQ
jgi:hypothetical protein